jgi:hypothetical protein
METEWTVHFPPEEMPHDITLANSNPTTPIVSSYGSFISSPI